MRHLESVVSGLNKEIAQIRAMIKTAAVQGDARYLGRCESNLSCKKQVRSRRRLELKAARRVAADMATWRG